MLKHIYLIFSLLFLFCSLCGRELEIEDKQVLKTPLYSEDISFVFCKFTNEIDNEYNRFQEILPKVLMERISKIDKIQFDGKRFVLNNKKDLITFYQKILKDLKDYKQYVEDKLEKPERLDLLKNQQVEKPEEQFLSYEDKKIEKIQKIRYDFLNQKVEEQLSDEYIEFYKKNKIQFDQFLGFNLDTYQLSFITVNTKKDIIDLNIKKIFDPLSITRKRKQDNEILVLGKLLKGTGKDIIIEIKFFDNFLKKFIYSVKFTFDRKEFNINLEDVIDKFVDDMKKNFFDINIPKGTLSIKTNPNEAIVYLSGKKVGMSDLTLDHDIGYYELEILKYDHEIIKKKIFIHKDKKMNLEFNLVKTKQYAQDELERSNIEITSNPKGADVYLDLKYMGQTPLFIKDVSEGSYKFRLDKENYESAYTELSLSESKNLNYHFDLNLGNTDFEDFKKGAKSLNYAKNIFFYFSFISFGAMVYSFVDEMKYYERKLTLHDTNATNTDEYQYTVHEYYSARNFRNIMIGTTSTSILLTIIFHFLELNLINREVGYRVKKSDSEEDKKEVSFFMNHDTILGLKLSF